MITSIRSALILMLVITLSRSASGETITLGSTAVNTVQIKVIKHPQKKKVFEIQLGGGANQPPRNTMIMGKATAVLNSRTHAGYFRLSTSPERQLRMELSKTKDVDTYEFISGYDVLNFEFAPNESFNELWLTEQITAVTCHQSRVRGNNQGNSNQNGTGQNGNQNNDENGNQNNGGRNSEGNHPPIVLKGSTSSPTGGTLAKFFTAGETELLLDVGGNQRLSYLTHGNSHSGMSLKTGSYSAEMPKQE